MICQKFTSLLCVAALLFGSSFNVIHCLAETPAQEPAQKPDAEIVQQKDITLLLDDEFRNEQLKVLADMYSQVDFVSAVYQPYVKYFLTPWFGDYFWKDTPRRFSVKMQGVKHLPPCELTIVFRNAAGVISQNVSDDTWTEGYVWNVYPGNLKEEPNEITAKIRLKSSGFEIWQKWKVNVAGSTASLISVESGRTNAKETLSKNENARAAKISFEKAVQQLRTEILTDLENIDTLNSKKVEVLQKTYNQNIVNLQRQFLLRLNSEGKCRKIEMKPKGEGYYYAEIAGVSAAGAVVGTAIALIPTITVTTTSWVFWTTTTTVAVGALGSTFALDCFISGGIITAVAAAGGVVYYFATAENRRQKIRDVILLDFDTNTAPKMRAWANVIIQKAFLEQPEEATK